MLEGAWQCSVGAVPPAVGLPHLSSGLDWTDWPSGPGRDRGEEDRGRGGTGVPAGAGPLVVAGAELILRRASAAQGDGYKTPWEINHCPDKDPPKKPYSAGRQRPITSRPWETLGLEKSASCGPACRRKTSTLNAAT